MPTPSPRKFIQPVVTAFLLLAAGTLLAQTDAGKDNTAKKDSAPPAAESAPAASSSPSAAPKSASAPRTGGFHAGHNPALPTVFFIGDSTVKNGRDTGNDGLWGWAHPVAAFFDATKINVENQGHGGTSSRTYITNGDWNRVLSLVKPGDFVVMQFGHNDGGGANSARGSIRGNGDETQEVTPANSSDNAKPETVHSYGWYLRKYIDDTKAKGATPIVCSLIPRNDWTDGKVRRATGSYATWAAEAAKQNGASFIDLNSIVADHYDQLGQDAVKPFFPKEHTHTAWRGAVLNAQSFIEGLKSLPDCALKNYLSETPNPVKPSSDPTDG
jgi:rhamnogalacturonan acetylesterase